MKIKVRLRNHGIINGVMREGDEIVTIDERDFTDTWMIKVDDVPASKKPNILKRILGQK